MSPNHFHSLPGDYGFDPLGLSDPEGTGGFIKPKWLAYGEIINGRYTMLGAVGALAPEILGKLGLVPPETALPWFKTGVIPPAGTNNYWADPYTLFVLEMALMVFAEHRRFQDWAKPRSMGKQYFLGFEKYLGGSGDPAYPGGPLFNPPGLGKDEKSMKDLKLKEVKNGRLAMLAILGYFCSGPCDWFWTLPEPLGSLGRTGQQQRLDQPQVPLKGCLLMGLVIP